MSDNILHNVGDKLLLNINSDINGKITFLSYTETWINLNPPTRGVKGEFRISSDSVFLTEWMELDISNVAQRIVRVYNNNLLIQIRYTRIGENDGVDIEFRDIQFQGTREDIVFDAPTINSSIFSNFVTTPLFRLVYINLFKKLYFRGILPKYITRGDDRDSVEDRDFIDLFFSVAKYFSMFIVFAKRFETFKTDFDLMREYVRQYNIYFDENNINLTQLQYLSQNYYNEIRRRGTMVIFNRQGDVLPSGETMIVDGEFMRLIRVKKYTEVLYELIPLHKIGWVVGSSSPLYKGTSQAVRINKTPDNTKSISNLDDYELINENNISLIPNQTENGWYDNIQVAKITNATINEESGFGNLSLINNDTKVFIADPCMDYEITFIVKVNNYGSNSSLHFGVRGFNSLKNVMTDAFISPINITSNDFFNQNLSFFRKGQCYLVRGIIYAYDSQIHSISKTNIGIGNNLCFNNKFVTYILPYITLIGDGSITIADYKIRPLIRGTNIVPLRNGVENSHSLGFIQCPRILYTYFRNNNVNNSESEITDIIETYLFPFNTTDILTFIR